MGYPIVVEEWDGIRVVRDDLVPGGTKTRVVHLLFDHIPEYVYASPCQGYAQVALAYACRNAGKIATIYCAKRRVMHPRTIEAAKAGANIQEVECGYLNNVQSKARRYCEHSGAVLLLMDGIVEAAIKITPAPSEVWTVAGSGTLSLALQSAWPQARFNAVVIGRKIDKLGMAKLWDAPERYEQPAKQPPPFPSCGNYDAKAWQFIKQYASKGALFWNVAG